MPDEQDDLFDGPADETEDGRPSGMRQRAPKKERGPDPVADMVGRANEHRRTGVCEGATMFRKRFLDLIVKSDTGDVCVIFDLLADIGEVDDTFRKQFGDEYQRQLDLRTK